MNLLDALASGPTAYFGAGINEEGEAFTGELSVEVLEGGRAALLRYVARLDTGKVVHTESTLLATGPNGRLCLWPVMSEIPVVLPHVELLTAADSGCGVKSVFGSGARGDIASFREEITIELVSGGSLIYSHAWGLPGGSFQDRSSCRMLPAPTTNSHPG